MKVLDEHKDITVNDLNTFSMQVQEKFSAGPGNVHYKPEGPRLLGIEVAEVISQILGIETKECPSSKEIIVCFRKYKDKT